MRNEYDNEHFFEEYAKMPRSRGGLAACRQQYLAGLQGPAIPGSDAKAAVRLFQSDRLKAGQFFHPRRSQAAALRAK